MTPLRAPSCPQGYQWLKDKILSEEGRRQQAKLKELQAIAERLGCTLPQLAIGTGRRAGGQCGTAGTPRRAQALLSLCPSLVPAQRGRELRPAGSLQHRPADGEHRSNTGQRFPGAARPVRVWGCRAATRCVGKGGCEPPSKQKIWVLPDLKLSGSRGFAG